MICTFVYMNGWNPDMFLELDDRLELGRDRIAYRHFEALLKYNV